MSQDYSTARSVIGIMEFLGWVVAVIGAIAGVVAFSQAGLAGAAMFVISGGALGVALVAMAQIVRAQVDTALNTAELVRLARATERSAPVVRPSVGAASKGVGHVKFYKGKEISRDEQGIRVGERRFANVIEAERWIDGV